MPNFQVPLLVCFVPLQVRSSESDLAKSARWHIDARDSMRRQIESIRAAA